MEDRAARTASRRGWIAARVADPDGNGRGERKSRVVHTLHDRGHVWSSSEVQRSGPDAGDRKGAGQTLRMLAALLVMVCTASACADERVEVNGAVELPSPTSLAGMTDLPATTIAATPLPATTALTTTTTATTTAPTTTAPTTTAADPASACDAGTAACRCVDGEPGTCRR